MFTIRAFFNDKPTLMIVSSVNDVSDVTNHLDRHKIRFEVCPVDGLPVPPSFFGFGQFNYWKYETVA